MSPLPTLLLFLISIATLCGITLHESKFDKFVSVAIGYSSVAGVHESSMLRTDTHTHVERVIVKTNLPTNTPTNRLRNNEFKQYTLPVSVVQGHHAFDNYLLPILS